MDDRGETAGPGQSATGNPEALLGMVFALSAFTIWGLLPVYFKAVDVATPLEIISHRALWAALIVGTGMILIGRLHEVLLIFRSRRKVLWLVLSAALLYGNFFLFVWAVDNNFILQGSLGYYINPIVNVVLGVVLLRERLSRLQWCAVALALSGVGVLTVGVGQFPWIAVSLALMFGFYGYVRKVVQVGAAAGFLFESLIFAPLPLVYLVYLGVQGTGAFGQHGLAFDALIAAAGLITAAPLILFTAAAKWLRYATLGIFQYLAPTMQFMLAVLVYGEEFTDAHKLTFALIWIGLALYSVDTWRQSKRRS